MRSPFDSFPPNALELASRAREVAMRSGTLSDQMRALENSAIRGLIEQRRHNEMVRSSLLTRSDLLDKFRSVSDLVRQQADIGQVLHGRPWQTVLKLSDIDNALTAAKLAQNFALPTVMEQFRTPLGSLTGRLLSLQNSELFRQPAYMDAFNRTSALSDLMGSNLRVDRELREATQMFARGPIPAFESLAGYRNFLDAAGLRLPRWPRPRLLSAAEKRRRFKERLKGKTEPIHVKRAKSLVHRYELTLREILDAVMAETYGEDWAEARLPFCDCRDLLGKWRKRGGDVLDHADYAHYSRIMSCPEHFEAVFEAGFDDPAALAALLNDAGRLRAASHHAHVFTPEDLRDLRVVWKTIETGLLAFTDDYELEPLA